MPFTTCTLVLPLEQPVLLIIPDNYLPFEITVQCDPPTSPPTEDMFDDVIIEYFNNSEEASLIRAHYQ